jgi:hypothetical protein
MARITSTSQVETGRKRLARAGQNHDVDGSVFGQFAESGDERRSKLRRKGVSSIGPVERQQGHAVGFFHE